MKYIDIHSHLDFDELGKDKLAVLQRMAELGVGTITIGTNLAESKDAVKSATENENVWASVGNHPEDAKGEEFDEGEYEKLVANPRVVAIGECGLDYFRPKGSSEEIESEKERQRREFERHIVFSIKHKKPLMLHIRDAYDDAYEILKKYEGKAYGNLHFFTSTLEVAERFIKLGFTISFPGIITYIRDFDKVIKTIPLDKIHAETDAPFATPVPHRGERNEPSYVIEVYKKIAEIRGEDVEMVRLKLLENARKLFGTNY